jgi:hypothetical protein
VHAGLKFARGAVLAAMVALGALAGTAARAADMMIDPAPIAVQAPPVTDGWRFISPFSPCEMNCTATVFVGRYIATPMTDIFIKYKTPPWNWKTKDSTLVSGAFNREIITYSDKFAFEGEIGVGKRFGAQDEWETWGAIYARWKSFPWNDYIRTTVAVSTGINYASDISQIEVEKSEKHQSKVLHYLSPEITLGLPDQPNFDLVFRFHHRSGGNLGIFNGTGGGSQYQTVGLRYRW